MDDADNTQPNIEASLADAIRHARAGGPVAVATGRCLHCDDITGDEQRWCGPECRDAYCKERGAK